jgi:pilus biogenesis lipoprotein CpaD
MNIRHANKNIRKLALISLMALTLEGCEVENTNLVPMPDNSPYILKHDKKALSLHFPGHRNRLPEDEKSSFLSALKLSGPGRVSIHLTIPSKGNALGKQRLKHIVRLALESGIKPNQIHKSDTLPPANKHNIEVLLETYRAIPPQCPNWSSVYGHGYDRGNTGNFGCATAVDFLLMLEDPKILFKGENATSHDAARDSLSVSDHRLAKDRGKWLKVEMSTSSSGGSGSSGAPTGTGG